LQRHGHVVAEGLLTLRIADQAPVAGRHVTRIEVDEDRLEAGVLHGLLDGVEVLTGRPPELHGGEAVGLGAGKALHKGVFLVENRNVDGVPHCVPLI
jgi:hypothetical protein